MLKLFFIYALIAGIIMAFYGFTESREALEKDLEEIRKDYDLSEKQVYTIFYVFIVGLGWLWLPWKIVNSIIKKIKESK